MAAFKRTPKAMAEHSSLQGVPSIEPGCPTGTPVRVQQCCSAAELFVLSTIAEKLAGSMQTDSRYERVS